MAHSYGPAKKPDRCVPKPVLVQSVRSWNTTSKNVDVVLLQDPSLDEQIVRMSREEAESLMVALKRVLESDKSCSWNPAAIADELKKARGD